MKAKPHGVLCLVSLEDYIIWISIRSQMFSLSKVIPVAFLNYRNYVHGGGHINQFSIGNNL